MELDNKKKIVRELNKTFLKAGDIAIELRAKGLIEEIKAVTKRANSVIRGRLYPALYAAA